MLSVKLLNITHGFVTRIVVMWLIQVYCFDNVDWATVETSDVIKVPLLNSNKVYMSNKSHTLYIHFPTLYLLPATTTHTTYVPTRWGLILLNTSNQTCTDIHSTESHWLNFTVITFVAVNKAVVSNNKSDSAFTLLTAERGEKEISVQNIIHSFFPFISPSSSIPSNFLSAFLFYPFVSLSCTGVTSPDPAVKSGECFGLVKLADKRFV